ncbi:hypothetical protein GCM10022255_057410 [Dactylosporangium darangshiense]|uniref:Uncharacterized protein n=1 Tax=Dactylosporangium darangshiense TaxID=579108 RepID=A0ABP8DEK3_9ACTN
MLRSNRRPGRIALAGGGAIVGEGDMAVRLTRSVEAGGPAVRCEARRRAGRWCAVKRGGGRAGGAL